MSDCASGQDMPLPKRQSFRASTVAFTAALWTCMVGMGRLTDTPTDWGSFIAAYMLKRVIAIWSGSHNKSVYSAFPSRQPFRAIILPCLPSSLSAL